MIARRRRWYSRLGVEAPFPWLGVLAFAGAAILVEGAMFVGLVMVRDCNLGW